MITGGFQIEGASVKGPHELNQDRYGYEVVANSAILVVADGAGSAKHSDKGAELAVEAVLEVAREMATGFTGDEIVTEAIARARSKIGGDRDLACTLSVVVWDDDVWVGLVGDSPVYVKVADEVIVLEQERESEFVNETAFISGDTETSTYWFSGETVSMVVLSSDGLTNLVATNKVGHEGFFTPLEAHLRSRDLDLMGLLESLLGAGRLGDDTTLVAARRA